MKNNLILGLSLLFSFESLSATVFHEIDTMCALQCTFSNAYQNRVMVKNGRIEKVVFLDDAITVKLEEESGQVFVYAVNQSCKEAVISIITEEGLVQDLEIHFENRPAEIVVLQQTKQLSYANKADIFFVIDKILSGNAPEGYCCSDCTREGARNIGVFILEAIARFKSSEEEIIFTRVANTSGCTARIREKDLCSKNSSWVYLAKDVLYPDEETLALIAYKRDFNE